MTDNIKRGVAETFRKLEQAFSSDPLERAVARTEGDEAPFAAATRAVEALLFVAGEALSADELAQKIPAGVDVSTVLTALREAYAGRGVELVEAAGRWRFQTAPDLAPLFSEIREQPRRLSKAALECLAVIAYHQPVTRAEVEEIRGVALSRGTLDHLLEIGWVRPRGRRRSPGRPVTYGTTDHFLSQFGLAALDDLPGKDDLRAAGVLDARLPPGFETPRPSDALADDEDPLEPGDEAPDFFVDHIGDTKDGE